MRERKQTDNRADIIKGRARMKGLGVGDLARRCGVSSSTLYRKLIVIFGHDSLRE